jgi:hypothetical protein
LNSLIATSPINKPKYHLAGCKEYENKGISSKNVEIEDFHIKKGPDKDAQLSYIKIKPGDWIIIISTKKNYKLMFFFEFTKIF